jgi:hypothetical protein
VYVGAGAESRRRHTQESTGQERKAQPNNPRINQSNDNIRLRFCV